MTPAEFVELLSRITFSNVFNPYRDVCALYDRADGPAIRCRNLEQYLSVFHSAGVDSLWLGRDFGYRGGRRTGIALTDEPHLKTLSETLRLSGIKRATTGEPMKERTATYIWESVSRLNASILLWNVFPFHPFEPGRPMSNRRHSASEFHECSEVLHTLVAWLQPKEVVVLGADAFRAASVLGCKLVRLRHPSYGGHREFAEGVRGLYG